MRVIGVRITSNKTADNSRRFKAQGFLKVMLSEAKHLFCPAARPFATLRVTAKNKPFRPVNGL
jgi:hypothetical protein